MKLEIWKEAASQYRSSILSYSDRFQTSENFLLLSFEYLWSLNFM